MKKLSRQEGKALVNFGVAVHLRLIHLYVVMQQMGIQSFPYFLKYYKNSWCREDVVDKFIIKTQKQSLKTFNKIRKEIGEDKFQSNIQTILEYVSKKIKL